MGNRAVITNNINGMGIYLHWNGGRDSVEAFLKYCELKGYRTDDYGMARLTQVIANFFGGTDSIGVDLCSRLDTDNGDNGTYIIKGWHIEKRLYFSGSEQNEYSMDEMLQAIDEAQPAKEQLEKFLKAKETKPEDLKIGDRVLFIDDLRGEVQESTVVGFGIEGGWVNGHEVGGVPYMNRWGSEQPETNCNNYIFKPVRVIEEEEPAPAEMTINEELKGIEIKFSAVPSQEIREALKNNGFRWHHKKAVWYAKKNPETLELATSIVNQFLK